MAYGDALGVSAPTVSVTVGPTYATEVNAYLDALRTVVEASVTPGGFEMTTDLSFLQGGVFRSAVDLLTAAFEVQADETDIDAATFPAAAFSAGADGDLFFNDAAGNQIRITASGAVNVSTTGGITGVGYGAGGAEVNFASGDQSYRFFTSTGVFADVVCDDVRLSDGSSNFVAIVSPSLTNDYVITLPTAVPASTSVVQMSAAGELSASPSGNIATTGTLAAGATTITGGASTSTTMAVGTDLTVGNDLTVTGDTSVGAFSAAQFNGGTTSGGDIDVGTLDVGTGGITTAGGMLVASGQNVTLQGSGLLKHGDRTLTVPSAAFVLHQDAASAAFFASGAAPAGLPHWRCSNTSGTSLFSAPLLLEVGKRVKGSDA